jgi:fructokinase
MAAGSRVSPEVRIGIDLGGTKTEGVVLNEAGDVLQRQRRPTPTPQGYEAIIRNVVDLVLALEAEAGRACRVGIGAPGSISRQSGLLRNSNTTCLNGRPLRADLERLLGRPVRIENDANCFILSEAVDGAARDVPTAFGVIMGTGVGGGIVLNGRLHEGLQCLGGEWGHNVLEPDGPPCYCGQRGCVELFLSGPGLVRDYEIHGGEPGHDAAWIAARADLGEPAADATIRRFLVRFGRALATVINILDPHVIVLGGGLSHMSRLYDDGPAEVARHVFIDEFVTPIRRNAHGDSSGVRGAAQLWAPFE